MLSCMTIGVNGRLGNQMFQFAALYGIAKKNNFDYAFTPGRLYEAFNMNGVQNSRNINPKFLYSEPSFSFNENVFKVYENTEIIGFFQTDKYWSHVEQDIRTFYMFKDEIKNTIDNNILNFCRDAVFIHVRRGDYLNKQQFHPVVDEEYCLRALEHVRSNKIAIFTDDVEWAKGLKKTFDSSKYEVEIISEKRLGDLQELFLMTQCNEAIISNSSFSWWGAYLGPHAKGNTVVAPSKWFGELGHKDFQDVYLETWKRS